MQQCDWWNTEKTGKGRPSAAIGCRTREGERMEKRLGMAALASMQIWLTCDPACLPRTDRCLSLTPCLLPPTVSGSTQVTVQRAGFGLHSPVPVAGAPGLLPGFALPQSK